MKVCGVIFKENSKVYNFDPKDFPIEIGKYVIVITERGEQIGKITTIEEYIKKTELKTAKLFETALCGGIELVAPHLEKLNSYPRHFGRGQGEGLKINTSDFARNFGIAFQVRDDLINAKTTQNDIKDGIYTAPVIFAGSAENFSSGIEKTQVLLNNYVDSAQKQIDLLRECEYKSALTKLLGLIRDE